MLPISIACFCFFFYMHPTAVSVLVLLLVLLHLAVSVPHRQETNYNHGIIVETLVSVAHPTPESDTSLEALRNLHPDASDPLWNYTALDWTPKHQPLTTRQQFVVGAAMILTFICGLAIGRRQVRLLSTRIPLA
jgi:hypothetical protein